MKVNIMKTLLTTLLTFLLINTAYACSIAIPPIGLDTYCKGWFFVPNTTGELERRAVCSVSEDAVAAQIELAQRYRGGYQPKKTVTTYSEDGIAISRTLDPCGRITPERVIYPNQSMADYWTKFSSVTKVVLLAQIGDADAQLEVRHFYLDRGEEYNMISLFRVNPVVGIIEKGEDLWHLPHSFPPPVEDLHLLPKF